MSLWEALKLHKRFWCRNLILQALSFILWCLQTGVWVQELARLLLTSVWDAPVYSMHI